MSGVLYIVATPIGNLDDITMRAIAVLREVDLVAAEDTRHSQRLLSHLGVRKKMLSLHEHNERERSQQLVELLRSGQNIALVSDAGTPLISDPGYPLLQAVIESGLEVVPVPGVSSIITALSAAGVPTDRFCFHGFLPHKNAERIARLKQIQGLKGTQILLESTHRIERLLLQIEAEMPQAQVVLAKELTKRHERFLRGSACECLRQIEQDPTLAKGEFVVLLHHQARAAPTGPLNQEKLLKLLLKELPLKKAVSLAVAISGARKNDLYQQALALQDRK